MSDLLQSLVTLSHELGREDRHLAILGEGNTSARGDDGTFWVKASGSQLGAITEGGFTQVKLDAILELVEREQMTQEEVQAIWPQVMVDAQQKRPSVETFLHALCLSEGGASWIAHTHPVSCNAILCSQLGAEPFMRPLFPDGIVVCGRHPAVVPYVDPGFDLAKAVRTELRRYQDAYGASPKLLLMVNHGITALGKTMQEALNITRMADKWARTLIGTYTLGGPHFMPDHEAARIDSRLDEHYRRSQLTGR
ncbi:class II aldolase/adducin family protein [Caldilinea sp.]|uniref:class II aldolase/adducin family protein n=1 Tax=Caldilinea sp. TaxID=2293560 RepID=UPI002BB07856|nr:class II aldolase/adducin family protein [Anaerolineales bacterium]HQY91187.1 class II aldolase/adducin family protein [Caldilinea sp.]